MYTIYSVAIVVFFALLSPYFVYQALRYRKYIRNLPQRLGYLPLSFNFDGDESIWIHAVSVGEVLTARALLPQLRERYPRLRIFLSTTTMTGQHVARTNLHDVDERVLLSVRSRRHRQPDAARGEAAAVHHDGNRDLAEPAARVPQRRGQDRARQRPDLARGRIRATGWRERFFRRVLADVDRFCMQSEESARRIVEIGADRERVTVTGSLKFDSLEMPGPAVGRSRAQPRAALFPDRRPIGRW